jgi:TonB family protein
VEGFRKVLLGLLDPVERQVVDKRLRGGGYRAVVRIWLGGDGRVQKVDLAGSTGDADLDGNIRNALAGITLTQPPPQDMPQPVRLRISSRGAG